MWKLLSPQIIASRDFPLPFLSNFQIWKKEKTPQEKSWGKTHACDLEDRQVTDEHERHLLATPSSALYACYCLHSFKGKKVQFVPLFLHSPFGV